MRSSDSLWERFKKDAKLPDCPIYDMHGHWGPFHGANLPDSDARRAIAHLDRAGVALFVFSSHEALYDPERGNAITVKIAREFPDRMRAYCCINPNYPALVERDLAGFDDCRDVYVGLKLHPGWHNAAMTDDRYKSAWEFADANHLVVLSHAWGGDSLCGYEAVSKVAEKYGGTTIIAGHSLHGRWDQAVELARRCPNVYLDTCAILDDRGAVERIVDEAGSERVLFGTDFPWFGYHYSIGALLGARMTDEDRRNILYRNAQRLGIAK